MGEVEWMGPGTVSLEKFWNVHYSLYSGVMQSGAILFAQGFGKRLGYFRLVPSRIVNRIMTI